MYPIVPVLSFISAVLALVPLIWYLQARNIAAVAIGIWLSITSLIHAIDALVWAQNVVIKAPAWCDISTSLSTGSQIALPAACFSICIHLERIASFCQTSTGTSHAKQRRLIFECLMCFGLPLVYMALHLIVQPHRFDLFYGFGCRPATFPTVATTFLVLIPPLVLTAATIICAGIAWRHFLVHGVQFYGKRGSVSSLTRNLYLRLVGMALAETALSTILTAVVMSHVFSSGLTPLRNMSRHWSEVLIWDPDAITDDVQMVLEVEWLVTVVQSVVYFALFACRVEAMREGWAQICVFPAFLKRLHSSVLLRPDASEQSFTSASVPTLPMTVVDLSVVIQSASTLTRYGHPTDSNCLPETMPVASRRASVVDDHTDAPESQDVVVSALVPSNMVPLESPSRVSAIASSHNSLESNFDPSLLGFSPNMWPQTPTTIPTRPTRLFSIGCIPRARGESWFEDVWDVPPQFARAKYAVHAQSCTADVFERRPLGLGAATSSKGEGRQAIHVTVVKETQ